MSEITWRCVLVGNRKDATRYVIECASEGIPARLFADSDNTKRRAATLQRFHVAVPEEWANGPSVWLLSIRGSDGPAVCTGDPALKHASEV